MTWPVVKLASVCQIDMGSAPKGDTYVELGEGTPLIAGAADYGVRYPQPKKATTAPTKVCVPGDIIICVRATIGDLNWADKEYCLGRGVAGLRVNKDKLDSKYLWYFILSYESELYRNATGSTFPQINRKVIESISVPLPPLEIQMQIADILEKTDQLRKDCEQIKQELNCLSQSVFIDMFGDPVTNAKAWNVKSLNDISTVQLGKMLSEKSKQGVTPKKYLRNANIRWRTIDFSDLLEMDFTEKEMSKFKLVDGDLLVCEGGEIGRCAIWRSQVSDCYYQKALHRVRVDTSICTPEYLQEYFYWMAQLGGFNTSTNEVTFKHLTAEKIKALLVPLPPKDMQEEYSNIYIKILCEMKENEQMQIELDNEFNSILNQAFTGELQLKEPVM